MPTPQVIDSYIEFSRTYRTLPDHHRHIGLHVSGPRKAAVSNEEARTHYDGFPSKPILIYRTRKGPQAQNPSEARAIYRVYYHSQASPRLFAPAGDLHALVNVIPALGLRIPAAARPKAQGTMCLYLNEGGDGGRLLGIRHVLFGPNEPNQDYVYHPSAPSRNVRLLGQKAYNGLVASIKLQIADLGVTARRWERQVREFEKREDDAAPARDERLGTQALLDKAMADMDELIALQRRVEMDWDDKDNRVLDLVLRSPGQPRQARQRLPGEQDRPRCVSINCLCDWTRPDVISCGLISHLIRDRNLARGLHPHVLPPPGA
jgi:hypothetical protein